jgi:hypothetical protein
MTMHRLVALTPFALLALLGCEGQKSGDPCDKFFQNTCKSPLSCVDMDDKKVCAGSCDWSTDPMPPHNTCKDPSMEPAEVQYMQGTTNVGGAGCYCLPKKGGAAGKASAAPSAVASTPPAATPTPAATPSAAPSAHPKPAPKKK